MLFYLTTILGLYFGIAEALNRGIHKFQIAIDSEIIYLHLNNGTKLQYCDSIYYSVESLAEEVLTLCRKYPDAITFKLISKNENIALPLAVKTNQDIIN